MPRDSARVRVTRRCQATGATHAVYRKFRLNRISFRNMALQGLLPGVTKASW
jgi:small subunit ribosomal protein S14